MFTPPSYGYTINGGVFMLNFILGSFFGGTVGVAAICLCTAAKWGDMENDI